MIVSLASGRRHPWRPGSTGSGTRTFPGAIRWRSVTISYRESGDPVKLGLILRIEDGESCLLELVPP